MSRYQLRSTVRSKPVEHSDLDVSSPISRRLRKRNNSPKAVAARPCKAAVTVGKKTHFRFLALPLKIRRQIYLYLTHGPIVSLDPRHRSYSETDLDVKRLALLFVNRQLYQEFKPVVFDNVVFKVPLAAAFEWTSIRHFAIDITHLKQEKFPAELSEVALRANYNKLLPHLVRLPSRLTSVTLFVGPEGRLFDPVIGESFGLPTFGRMRTGEVYRVDETLRWRFLRLVDLVTCNQPPLGIIQVVSRLWRRDVDVSLELRPMSDCGRVCQIVFKKDWTLEARAVRPPGLVVDSSHTWKLPTRVSQQYLRRLRAGIIQ